MTAAAWPAPITAVTLFVEDFDQTKTFYSRAFDLPTVFEDANSAVFRIGDVLVNVLRSSAAPELVEPAGVGGPDAGSRFMLTITVEDVDAVCAELERRGIPLLNGPIDRPWGVRTAAFADPAGHVWEVAS
jgi:catechol 2,3-dioxygenase-like lactoylglutathione lyase family enzyme